MNPRRENAAAKRISVEEIKADAGEPDGRVECKTASAESSLIVKEMDDCVRKYIDKLPPSQRLVIVLSLFEGLKNIEIAKILGITLETVKIRLHRGRA